MSEHLSTQETVDNSTGRRPEETELRDFIHRLEEQSRGAHGTKAEELETKILANEDKLRIAEKATTNKVSTPTTPNVVEETSINKVSESSVTDVVEKTSLDKVPVEKKSTSTQETSPDNQAQALAERAQVGEARANMIAAEAAFLGAFRQQHKDQGALARLAGKNSPEKIQRDRTQELREEYDKTRVEFASAVNSSVQRRFDTKHATKEHSDVELRTEKVHKEKVLNRYNHMVVSSDVIKRSLQEKARAKQEGLGESERLSLGKAFGWYTRGNEALEKKVGKTVARGIRILIFATIGAGGVSLDLGNRIMRTGIGTSTSIEAGHLPTKSNLAHAEVGKPSSTPEHVSVQGSKEVISASEEKSDGADALFGNLKESLRVEYPDQSIAPPEVQHILNTRLHELSTEYGFAKSGKSGLMHTQNALSYNQSNGSLIFTDTHGEHVLESTLDGKLVKGATFDKFNGHYTQDSVPNTSNSAEQAVAPEIVTTPVTEHVTHVINGLTSHDGVLHTVSDSHTEHNQFETIEPGINKTSTHSEVSEELNSPKAVTGSVGTTASELLQDNELGRYAHDSFSDVLYKSPDVSQQMHDRLVETVVHSGIGPTNNESLEHFLHRANEAVTEKGVPTYEVGVHGLSVPVNQTQIYTDTHGDLVVYGGDSPAQHLVAYQYLSKHPDARILFDRSANDKASGINALTIHRSPLSLEDSQLLQIFTPLRDSSGKIIQSIDPSTLVSVVQ